MCFSLLLDLQLQNVLYFYVPMTVSFTLYITFHNTNQTYLIIHELQTHQWKYPKLLKLCSWKRLCQTTWNLTNDILYFMYCENYTKKSKLLYSNLEILSKLLYWIHFSEIGAKNSWNSPKFTKKWNTLFLHPIPLSIL